jgi:dTDP-4-amino-4,6-dideoxygalactose transaminase
MIPFNRHARTKSELEYVSDVLARGILSGDGSYGRRAEGLLRETLGAAGALLTTSCTHALEMSALLVDIRPGDEVILPSFTFVSTVNAFVLRGAKPVFSDIRPDTLNLDESRLEDLVTMRTKLIVPVHYAGVGCEMDVILEIARRAGASVVEDNAHGLFGQWRGKALGTFGALATQSFHETKNISCGEGGALVIRDDERLIERAEVIREKGTNRSRFHRGQVDKYTWVDVGSSYVLSDVLGAILLAQLEERAEIQRRRQTIWERYARELAGWAAARDIRLPFVPDHCVQPFHMFYLLMPSLERRTAFIDHLAARDVKAVFHYIPLHTSAMGTSFGGRPGDCPVTERVSDQLVRLPLYADLTESDQTKVIEAVHAFA